MGKKVAPDCPSTESSKTKRRNQIGGRGVETDADEGQVENEIVLVLVSIELRMCEKKVKIIICLSFFQAK